ncbi:transmembrane protein 79-like isoform X2 [Myxocyprinus asiaticus]|uniref:transmembrane protein 79-like isoform X2 n=1 Tax=Myxocyprinus asiaticus TaxID=70543 RepID=UPI0022213702|nr:transmembrane protein 79-like isoform X2 [Myxocyprinus asiaticus]
MDKGPPGPAAEPQTPERVSDVAKRTKDMSSTDRLEEGLIRSAYMEPSTLQWPENKLEPQILAGKDGESTSVRSDCITFRGRLSRTESEREEFGMRVKRKLGEDLMKPGKERLEVAELNVMPENAARVFSPNITILHSTSQTEFTQETVGDWRDGKEEKSSFLVAQGTHGTPLEDYDHDWIIQSKPRCCCCGETNRDALKLSASMFTSALIFPLLVWGGYVFLPFDAPLLDTAPLRLVYTLRCSVFGVIPIVLGMLVLGVSRLRYRSLRPRFEEEREVKHVTVHQHYVEDSLRLFLLYFLQLAVMAAYLTQDWLKLVPLLTIVFALGRFYLRSGHPRFRNICSFSQAEVLGLDRPHLKPLQLPNVDQICLGLETS